MPNLTIPVTRLVTNEELRYPSFSGQGKTLLNAWRSPLGVVAVVTELDDNPAASITNAAEDVHAELLDRFGTGLIHVEHYRGHAGAPGARELREGAYDVVEVPVNVWARRPQPQVNLCFEGSAEWRRLDRAQLEELIGTGGLEELEA